MFHMSATKPKARTNADVDVRQECCVVGAGRHRGSYWYYPNIVSWPDEKPGGGGFGEALRAQEWDGVYLLDGYMKHISHSDVSRGDEMN